MAKVGKGRLRVAMVPPPGRGAKRCCAAAFGGAEGQQQADAEALAERWRRPGFVDRHAGAAVEHADDELAVVAGFAFDARRRRRRRC
jgi:hypothetical protein